MPSSQRQAGLLAWNFNGLLILLLLILLRLSFSDLLLQGFCSNTLPVGKHSVRWYATARLLQYRGQGTTVPGRGIRAVEERGLVCDVLWCVCALLEGQAVHQPPRGVFGLHFGAAQLTSCWRRRQQTWLSLPPPLGRVRGRLGVGRTT